MPCEIAYLKSICILSFAWARTGAQDKYAPKQIKQKKQISKQEKRKDRIEHLALLTLAFEFLTVMILTFMLLLRL